MRPEIGFKGFADEWEQHKLSEICDFEKGKGLSKDDISDNGKYPCILYGQLFTEYGMFINSIFSKSNTISDECKLSEKGDILIPRCDTTPDGLGRASALSVNNVILGFDINILKIKNKKDYNFNYVSVALNFHRKDLLSKVVGSTVRHLENKELRDILIESPCSIEEQKKIASLFQCIENLITLHQRKQSCNTLFINVWEQRKLDDVAEFSKGNGYSKGDLIEVGTPIILYGRLYTKYETNISDVDTYVEAKEGSVYSKGGEVIVPASGETAEDIARAATVDKSGILLGGDLNVVIPNKDINSAFMAISISNGNSQRELAKKAQGKSVIHIHNEEIRNLIVPFPNKVEQDKIVDYFTNLDHLITLHRRA